MAGAAAMPLLVAAATVVAGTLGLGAGGLVVAALETHGVTTKDPAAHARKASKKH